MQAEIIFNLSAARILFLWDDRFGAAKDSELLIDEWR